VLDEQMDVQTAFSCLYQDEYLNSLNLSGLQPHWPNINVHAKMMLGSLESV